MAFQTPQFNKLNRWLPLAAAAVLVIGILLGLGLQKPLVPLIAFQSADKPTAAPGDLATLDEILRYIEVRYVDDVDRQTLLDDLRAQLLARLDPHSVYVPASEMERHQANLSGRSLRMGLEVIMLSDSLTVVSVDSNSSAFQTGIQPYDRILSVSGKKVSGQGLSLDSVHDIISDLPEGPIQLMLSRHDEPQLLPVKINRSELSENTVGQGLLLAPGLAYIPVYQFSADTYDQFMQQLERLVTKQDAQDLILDLRGNAGGYVNEAVKLLSQFFNEEGLLLLYTEGANSPKKEYKSSGRVLFPIRHLVVLIDEQTASSSEIIAGAIQDWDRGIIVGRSSFGKGLVQSLYPLADGSAIHLTISRYFTPAGRSIQKSYPGLTQNSGSNRDAFQERAEAKLEFVDSSKQVFSTARGRKVYGNGGITPDVRVENRPLLNAPANDELQQLLQDFVFEKSEQGQNQKERELQSDWLQRLKKAGWNEKSPQPKELLEEMNAEISLIPLYREGNYQAADSLKILGDPVVQEAMKQIRSGNPGLQGN